MFLKPFIHPLIGPYPVKIGISLHQMQMCIHCFLIVDGCFTDKQIMSTFPVTRKDFKVSVIPLVERIIFKKIKNILCCFKRRFIARCPEIFSQSIDEK